MGPEPRLSADLGEQLLKTLAPGMLAQHMFGARAGALAILGQRACSEGADIAGSSVGASSGGGAG